MPGVITRGRSTVAGLNRATGRAALSGHLPCSRQAAQEAISPGQRRQRAGNSAHPTIPCPERATLTAACKQLRSAHPLHNGRLRRSLNSQDADELDRPLLPNKGQKRGPKNEPSSRFSHPKRPNLLQVKRQGARRPCQIPDRIDGRRRFQRAERRLAPDRSLCPKPGGQPTHPGSHRG